MGLKKYVKHFLKWSTYIVCTLFLQAGGGGGEGVGVWISNQIFEKGGLTGSEFLEEGCRKRRVTFFSRGEELQFLHKKETKILNFKWQKKIYKQKNVYLH